MNIRLKIGRIEAGLTQQQLADKIGARERDIMFWETERRRPTSEQRRAIADALHKPIFELFMEGGSQ